ncbi:MAG: ABC transporter ATP-binding protein [Oscillospiraceae bacterium]|nr:ABC transporter ATP-binding protein [Oscillospiraceae bacterium]
MIEIREAVKKFGGTAALDKVTLDIEKGKAFGLLGANGAGKSTLLRLLCGVYSPDGGNIVLDGEEVFDCPTAKEKIVFVCDETVQFGYMTLPELKSMYKGFYPKFSEEIYSDLLSQVKLPINAKMLTFSKGMKRQAAIITALACRTDYILLDEAFDGIDPAMRLIVKGMLKKSMAEYGLTAVISSHNLAELNELCDSAALINKGRVIWNKALDNVGGRVHKIQTAFPAEHTDEEILSVLGADKLSKTGSVYSIIVKLSAEEIKARTAPLEPYFVDIVPLSLEEIFIYETGSDDAMHGIDMTAPLSAAEVK